MSGRHAAPRAVGHRRVRLSLTAAAVAAAVTLTSAAATTSGAAYTDRAGGQFYVAAGEWCPSNLSTADGPVVFERATGLPTDRPHVMCSPSDTYRMYWQSDGNVVIYQLTPWMAVLAASSGGADSLVLGTDGNLTVALSGAWSRSTGTAGIPGPVALSLDDTGRLSITDATGVVRWVGSAETSHPCPPAGEFLCTP